VEAWVLWLYLLVLSLLKLWDYFSSPCDRVFRLSESCGQMTNVFRGFGICLLRYVGRGVERVSHQVQAQNWGFWRSAEGFRREMTAFA
jgi:hypothetical protein